MAVLAERLRRQQLTTQAFDDPAALVRWCGAVQAQDLAGGKWAIGLRTRGATVADIDAAIAGRRIVRTWPMRGTLHFVAAEDVRWLLGLLAPRVLVRAAGRYRELGLDAATFARAETLLVRALRGGQLLARPAAMQVLARGGVDPAGQRGIHVLGWLAMRGVICHATPLGKQPAFALLGDWVPAGHGPSWRGDDALGEIARRYFQSHAPATAADFAWWTGLNLTEARRAMALVGDQERGDAAVLGSGPAPRGKGAWLLPPWDEYTVGYRDRAALVAPAHAAAVRAPGTLLRPTVMVDGRIVATWTRTLGKAGVSVAVVSFGALAPAQRRAIGAASERYASFLGHAVARVGFVRI